VAEISKLEQIVASLRGKHGCPWDKKQTPQTLKKYLLEEVYELIEAIEEKEPQEVKEELGDVLFILVFLAHIYKEQGYFDLENTIDLVSKKMIRRHPHVFGDIKTNDMAEIRARWQEIKSREKPQRHSLLDGVSEALPALSLAYKIGEKATQVGFDWQSVKGVLEKVAEETQEFKKALDTNNVEKIKEELGDVLFSWVNVARLLKISPEDALRQTIKKFKKRFKLMENEFKRQGKSIQNASLKEMDALWEQIKKQDDIF